MSLDAQIDALYGLPLSAFTQSRNALAKTLSGDEARLVRSLAKPTLVPWTVNQLFWTARPFYDRLIKSGTALRDAQIAALKGKDVDAREAADAHRRALADAVRRATELASDAGWSPSADDLSRMLEAISLSPETPDYPGRWIEPVEPAGFEALAGVQPVARQGQAEVAGGPSKAAPGDEGSEAAQQREARRKEAQRAEAERRRLEANVRSAEEAVTQAKAAEAQTREALDRATEERRAAEATLAAARKALAQRGQ